MADILDTWPWDEEPIEPCRFRRHYGARHPEELRLWRERSQQFMARIRPIVSAWSGDAEERVIRVVDTWARTVHARLRGNTRFQGASKTGSMSVRIKVEEAFSPPLLKSLWSLTDDQLEMLLLWPELRRAKATLRATQNLWPPSPRPTNPPFVELGDAQVNDHLGRAEEILEGLDAEVEKLLRRAFLSLLEPEDECGEGALDLLGAYFIQSRHIELYWIPIWQYARILGVTVEDLALVVLVHEMAHFYSHRGTDSDGHLWKDPDMISSHPYIVEGIAQFYTERVCELIEANNPGCRPANVFSRLTPKQPAPYQAYQRWASGHGKPREVIRLAFVNCRARPEHRYSGYKVLLKNALIAV